MVRFHFPGLISGILGLTKRSEASVQAELTIVLPFLKNLISLRASHHTGQEYFIWTPALQRRLT